MENKIIIAIDGYSSCGKSTLAKALAKELNYAYVDTGAMYRAVTFNILNANVTFENLDETQITTLLDNTHISFHYNHEHQMSECWLNGHNVEKEIRSMQVANHVSMVSQHKLVRQRLVTLQQQMGLHKGIVMDGRDIGTTVFPGAELKIFMTASPTVRALRRYNELQGKNVGASLEEIRANLDKRDYEDTNRSESPLRKASDALILDNSDISPKAQLDMALHWALERKAALGTKIS